MFTCSNPYPLDRHKSGSGHTLLRNQHSCQFSPAEESCPYSFRMGPRQCFPARRGCPRVPKNDQSRVIPSCCRSGMQSYFVGNVKQLWEVKVVGAVSRVDDDGPAATVGSAHRQGQNCLVELPSLQEVFQFKRCGGASTLKLHEAAGADNERSLEKGLAVMTSHLRPRWRT